MGHNRPVDIASPVTHMRDVLLILQRGFSDDSIFAIGQDLDTENEIVRKLTLGEVTKETMTTKYFSIMVVKRV